MSISVGLSVDFIELPLPFCKTDQGPDQSNDDVGEPTHDIAPEQAADNEAEEETADVGPPGDAAETFAARGQADGLRQRLDCRSDR